MKSNAKVIQVRLPKALAERIDKAVWTENELNTPYPKLTRNAWIKAAIEERLGRFRLGVVREEKGK